MRYLWPGMFICPCNMYFRRRSDCRISFHIGENTLGSKFGDMPKFEENVMQPFSSFLEEIYRVFFISILSWLDVLHPYANFLLFSAPSIRRLRALKTSEAETDLLASGMYIYT